MINVFCIVYPDAVINIDRDLVVTQPSVATFVCTAMGIPRPSITWYKVEMDNSHTMLSGTELGVSITLNNSDSESTLNSTLVLYPTRPFHSAVYICESTNLLSSTDTNASLTVYGTYTKAPVKILPMYIINRALRYSLHEHDRYRISRYL